MTPLAVVTGGTSGIGKQAARHLLESGWSVVVAARHPHDAAAELGAVPVPLDLASLQDVRGFRARLDAALPPGGRPPLRAVVANAGVQARDRTSRTQDDFELTFGVNHLGHVLLLEELKDLLAPPARVVVVSSGTHFGTLRKSLGYPAPRWEAPEALAHRPATQAARDATLREGQIAYATSKLANILYVRALTAPGRLPEGVLPAAYDPGLVPDTGLARDFPPLAQAVYRRVGGVLARVAPFATTPQATGRLLAHLAAGETPVPPGAYVERSRVIDPSPLAQDAAIAEELYAASLRLVQR